ncbi:hypothetical protein HaLaN_22178 [Haematococcus lacustris]|uniref:Uncharacterized protein n=1 Tax=Haematococcus lacustris TaxID=44745 RepID=A0A699ZXM5_HAELA|nr:hypothetical protein HaLaN_22178 [Haematococcus lacustris]
MQQLQQQLQDLQRSELQRKEQQLADLVAQQGAALLQWEHQLTERQHQLICRLSATRGAAAAGSPHAAAADRPATKQTAGGEAAFGLFAGYQQQPPPPRPFSMLSHKVGKPTSRASYCGPRIVQPNPASAKQPFLPATTTSALSWL